MPGIGGIGPRPALREQIAFAPSTQSAPVELPSWMSKLDKMGNRSSSRQLNAGQDSAAPPQIESPSSNTVRPSFSPAGSQLPQHELRIKVWEDTETGDLPTPEAQSNERKEEPAKPPSARFTPEQDFQLEDLPTTPMLPAIVPGQDERPFSPRTQEDQRFAMEGQTYAPDRADADLPTKPLTLDPQPPIQAQANRPVGRPFPAQSYRQAVSAQAPPGQAVEQPRQGFPAQAEPFQRPIVQRPLTPALPPVSLPGSQQPATSGITPEPFQARPARRKSKMRLVVALVLLLLLLVGGLTTAFVFFHPFSVPAVTNPTVAFQNTDLGITLQYPQGWTAQLDRHSQAVSFFDPNHTDQVNVSVTAVNGQSVEQFIKKEASQLGLTAQKNLSPLTFAGTTWQQLQGSALLGGASYTETLLVTTHGDHFYTVVQMAPATTYTGAEHIFFSKVRASFQFLS